MLTSFAPSPMARVTSFVFFLIISTISALFLGVALQTITTEQYEANDRKVSLFSGFNKCLMAYIVYFFKFVLKISDN
jgi:hypothetical protein